MDGDIKFGNLSGSIGFYIRLLQIAAFKDFEEHTKSFGVAPRYFGLLTLIEANPGLPQGRFGACVHLARSSLVPILDKLEAGGLVERRPSPQDRRVKAIWLSARGKQIMSRLAPLVVEHEERLTNGFSSAESATLLGLLQRAERNLTKRDIDEEDVA
jgi:DNA-binding MarR family transcriptional regulator